MLSREPVGRYECPERVPPLHRLKKKCPVDRILREASEADLPAISAIYTHYVETSLGTFEEAPPSIDEMARRWRRTLDQQLPYLVVERDGAVRGYCHAGPYRSRSAYRHSVEDSVYIDPGWLRRGLAALLLDELILRCAALGYRQMVAVIGGSDNAGSIRLHQRCGFHEVGILRGIGSKFGAPVDTVLMQRALQTAETAAGN